MERGPVSGVQRGDDLSSRLGNGKIVVGYSKRRELHLGQIAHGEGGELLVLWFLIGERLRMLLHHRHGETGGSLSRSIF